MSKPAPLLGVDGDARPETALALVGAVNSPNAGEVMWGEECAVELRIDGDAAALLGMLACELRLLSDEREAEAAAAAAEKEV